MATYAIGDLQGCFDELQALLKKIKFDPKKDKLWFAGDLVNRGPKSLECVRFVKSLGNSAVTVLGNHDLSCLAKWYCKKPPPIKLRKLFNAKDAKHLMHWLQKQPLAYYDKEFDTLMVHAGVPPAWSLSQTMLAASELKMVLNSKRAKNFYQHMYGNQPDSWKSGLKGNKRLRYITNALTRMRWCTKQGALDLDCKASPSSKPKNLLPWFEFERELALPKVIFGHWAALMGNTGSKQFIGVDTGCVWGHYLTAYRLDDGHRFTLKAMKH
jgi:bis(5'-nucleosyl)-tetraphosphatase (symmetrical)